MARAWSLALIVTAIVGGAETFPPRAAADSERAGVVVERASPDQMPGLHPGDVLLSWRQSQAPGGETGGAFDRPSDLWRIRPTVIPRQPIELQVRRDDHTLWLEVREGPWTVELRPHLEPNALAAFRDGRERRSNDLGTVLEIWRRFLAQEKSPITRTWWAIKILESQVRFGDAVSAEAEVDRYLSRLDDPFDQLFLLERVGVALQRLGDFAAASARFARGLAIIEHHNLGPGWQARWLNWVAVMDLGSGHLEAARAGFQKASEVIDRWVPQGMTKATALSGLGHVARQQGALEVAEAAWRHMEGIYSRIAPGSRFQGKAFSNLGILEYDRGRMSAAEDYFQESLKVAQRLDPKSPLVALALNNLAECHRERGLLEDGEILLQQAYSTLSEVAPISHEMALVLDSMGSLAHDRGDLVGAEDFYTRMLKVYRRLAPQSLDTAYGLHRLGALALARGDLKDALVLTEEARKMRSLLAPKSPELANSLLQIAELARRRGDLGSAKVLAQEALGLQAALAPGSLRTSESLHFLGELAQQSATRGGPAEELDEAIDYLDRALAIRRQFAPHSAAESETLLALGRAWMHRERETAIRFYSQALVALESQIGRLGGTESQRSRYRAHANAVYDEYLELLLELGRPKEAFDVLERSRARGFLELLAGRNLLSDELPAHLVNERRDLAVRYERTQEDIRNAKDSSRARSLLNHLDRLRRRYEQVGVELRRLSPKYQALRPTRILNVAQVARQLDPGTVLLSFHSAASGGHAFALDHDGDLVTAPLPPEHTLRHQVDLLSRLIDGGGKSHIGQRRQRRAEALLRTLYLQFVGPLEAKVARAERLLILPDGPLHRLPWGALIRSPKGTGIRYLIEWKPLYLALSATVHNQLQAARPATAGHIAHFNVAAFGDPDYGSGDSPASWRSVIRRGLDLTPLPASRFEVESIATLFPRSQLFFGREAVEEQVKKLPRSTQIVHFAVHGLLDPHSPLDSALAFSRPDPSLVNSHPARDNGLLQAWEILESIRLDAELVMLSACNTGLGEELAGEGLIGLTRAFQVAGARSVAAALWPVPDLSTQALVVRFYEHLRAGQPKADALRAAQLDLLAGPVTVADASGSKATVDASLPVHWAGFQIYGDWQ